MAKWTRWADRDGRSFLLRRAQDQLRYTEAAKQAAILNALPAHIAMIDNRGLIVSVNEAWRRYARTNALPIAGFGMGMNYLEICESAQGHAALESRHVAEGIRSVLAGTANPFLLEYSCHSPTEERWFLMTATPLAGDRPNGAVIMHVDVTAERPDRSKSARQRVAVSADGGKHPRCVLPAKSRQLTNLLREARLMSRSGAERAKACMPTRTHGPIPSIQTICPALFRTLATAAIAASITRFASSVPTATCVGYRFVAFRSWMPPGMYTGQRESPRISPNASKLRRNCV